MEGTPVVALHFLKTAVAFAATDHRRAAFYFFNAAKYPGVSPVVRARALLEAAGHIHAITQEPSSKGDLSHRYYRLAVQWLITADGLLHNNLNKFDIHMKVLALLEDLQTKLSDYPNSLRTIRSAFNVITNTRDVDRGHLVKWWVYFRCRVIDNTVAGHNTADKALQRADLTAKECVKLGLTLPAQAFRLAYCQVSLSLPVVPGVLDVRSILTSVQGELRQLSARASGQDTDIATMHFCCVILQTFACIREGQVTLAKQSLIGSLKSAYGDLRKLLKVRHVSTWQWMPHKLMQAFTLYAIAAVVGVRQGDKSHDPWLYHSAALGQLGIDPQTIEGVKPREFVRSQVATGALNGKIIPILERAARYKLRSLDFGSASGLVSLAVTMAFDNDTSLQELAKIELQQPGDERLIMPDGLRVSQVMQRSAALLLLAEYHQLRGRISGAHVATQLMKVISSIPARYKDHSEKDLVTDSWQMAMSHLTLLEGKCRPTNIATEMTSQQIDVTLDARFGNRHALAAAWVTIGVFHMRNNDVMECRRVLNIACRLLRDGTGANEQLELSAVTSFLSMDMTAPEIRDEVWERLRGAIQLAQLIDDPVAMVRLRRQSKKLVSRMGLSPTETEAATRESTRANMELHRRQERAHVTILL